jgi:hypothetical protein
MKPKLIRLYGPFHIESTDGSLPQISQTWDQEKLEPAFASMLIDLNYWEPTAIQAVCNVFILTLVNTSYMKKLNTCIFRRKVEGAVFASMIPGLNLDTSKGKIYLILAPTKESC